MPQSTPFLYKTGTENIVDYRNFIRRNLVGIGQCLLYFVTLQRSRGPVLLRTDRTETVARIYLHQLIFYAFSSKYPTEINKYSMESANPTATNAASSAADSTMTDNVSATGVMEHDDNDNNEEVSNAKTKKSNKRKVTNGDDSKNISLPRASVKRIMRLPENVGNITGEAAAIVSRATELFLEKIVLASSGHTQSCKKKQIKLENIASVIYGDQKKYEFLNNAFGPLKKV